MAGDAFASGVRRFGPPVERPLLPWETPGLAAFFAPVGSMWLPDPLLVRAGRCPPLPLGGPVPVETAGAVAKSGQPVCGHKRTTRKTSFEAGETDQGVEEEAKLTQIARWRVVIAIFGNECSTGRQLADLEEEAAQDVLSNIFAGKAANTLNRRATSWTLFLRWHLRELGADFNGVLTEPLVYTYVETLRKQAAPATRAQSFIEAVGFAKGTIGCSYDVDSVVSARVKGAAYRSWETKRVTIRAEPMKVHLVAALEAYVYGEAHELEDRETAGFVLYVTMARIRAGDAARITQEPSLDCGEQDDGYAEAEAHRGKTIRGRKRIRLSLPIVAFSKGVLLPWAGTWLEVRKKLGLDAATDGALRMARGAGGHWVARVPATATEIGSDFRRILRQCGMEDDDLEGITSHSCKATLLSWAAKAGMKLEDRRLLRGHAKPGQKVPLEYSRDALAGPLERMRHVLGEIRAGGRLAMGSTRD